MEMNSAKIILCKVYMLLGRQKVYVTHYHTTKRRIRLWPWEKKQRLQKKNRDNKRFISKRKYRSTGTKESECRKIWASQKHSTTPTETKWSQAKISHKTKFSISHSCAISVQSTESSDYEGKIPNYSFCLTLFQPNTWKILISLPIKQL